MFNSELFVNRRDVSLSLRFGFIGLGQAGGKMVDAFYELTDKQGKPHYQGMAVNSFSGDLKALKNVPEFHRYGLKGYEKGCARDPRLGYQALEEHDNNKRVFEMMERIFADAEFIFICAGLGGGTGTGTLLPMIDYVKYLGKPAGVIITIPRNADSMEEKANALEVLMQLDGMISRGEVAAVIPVPNEKLYRDYLLANKQGLIKNDVDWKQDSNRKIAGILHEINIATALASSDAFDSGDFQKILLQSGCLQFTKTKVHSRMESMEELAGSISRSIKNDSMLASGFDHDTASHLGVIIFRPRNMKHSSVYNDMQVKDLIEKELKKAAPHTLGEYTGLLEWESDYVLIYTVIGGLALPGCCYDLEKEVEDHRAKILAARKDRQPLGFKSEAVVSSISMVKTDTAVPKTNPFAKDAGKNPFRSKEKGEENQEKEHFLGKNNGDMPGFARKVPWGSQ